MLVYGKQRTDYLAPQKKKKRNIKWRSFYYQSVLLQAMKKPHSQNKS